MEIVAGTLNTSPLDSEAQMRNVAEIKIHERFDGNKLLNDIAAVKLDWPFEFNDDYINAIPLALPCDEREKLMGRTGYVSGWGKIGGYQPYTAVILMFAEMKVTTDEVCEEDENFTDEHLCIDTDDETKSVCGADSGGPFVYNGRLVGIVSSNYGDNCQAQKPNVFTLVTHHLEWIKSKTGLSV